MNTRSYALRKLLIAMIVIFPILLVIGGCQTIPSYAADKTLGVKGPKLSVEELQAAVVNFTDRFIATIGQAAFEFEEALPTHEARLMAARRKVYTLSAAATIASGPNPAASMLDMVVLATLNRMVWENHWRPNVFGAPADIMVDAFKKTEDDIFAIAAMLMTPQQIVELRELITDWQSRNQKQLAVDFIRFSDFGGLGRKPELKKIKAPGGLLAPVTEAAQAADEIRLMSERAMFLLTKMQLIMGLRADLVYKELVVQPEVQDMLEHVNDFKNQLSDLPDQIAQERHAALNEISAMVAKERIAVLEAFDQRESKLRAILSEIQGTMTRADTLLTNVQQTMTSTERIIGSVQTTGTVFNEVIQSSDRLAARLGLDKPNPQGKPFDVNDYIPALEKLNQTLRDANILVGTVDQASTPLVKQVVLEFNQAAEKRIDHAFTRLLILFGFIGLMSTAIVFIHHRLKKMT